MAFELDRRFTVANVIQIGLIVVGGFSGFLRLDYQVSRTQSDVIAIQVETEKRIARFEAVALQYDARIRAVELAQAVYNADLRAIQGGLNEIKEQLRRMSGLQ